MPFISKARIACGGKWNRATGAEFYKSIKSNTGYSASPTHRVRTQNNHLFLSMVAFMKLEAIKALTRLSHFALKARLTQNALKHSWQQWKDYKQASTLLALYA